MKLKPTKVVRYAYLWGFVLFVLILTAGLSKLFELFSINFFSLISLLGTIYIFGALCTFVYKLSRSLAKFWLNLRHNQKQEKWKTQLDNFDRVIVYTIRTEKDSKSRFEIDKHLLWLGFDPKEIDAVWKVFDAQPR